MQFFNSPLLLVAVFTALAAASPVVPALEPRATPCTSAQNNLAKGIDKNIAIQKQEQTALKAISDAQGKGDLSDSQWEPLKSNLVDVVNQGIDVRKNNQKIAPSGSPATAGLAKVASAQAAELKLAQGLTGKADNDKADLATLKDDFAGGIKQNQQNKKDALNGCTQN